MSGFASPIDVEGSSAGFGAPAAQQPQLLRQATRRRAGPLAGALLQILALVAAVAAGLRVLPSGMSGCAPPLRAPRGSGVGAIYPTGNPFTPLAQHALAWAGQWVGREAPRARTPAPPPSLWDTLAAQLTPAASSAAGQPPKVEGVVEAQRSKPQAAPAQPAAQPQPVPAPASPRPTQAKPEAPQPATVSRAAPVASTPTAGGAAAAAPPAQPAPKPAATASQAPVGAGPELLDAEKLALPALAAAGALLLGAALLAAGMQLAQQGAAAGDSAAPAVGPSSTPAVGGRALRGRRSSAIPEPVEVAAEPAAPEGSTPSRRRASSRRRATMEPQAQAAAPTTTPAAGGRSRRRTLGA